MSSLRAPQTLASGPKLIFAQARKSAFLTSYPGSMYPTNEVQKTHFDPFLLPISYIRWKYQHSLADRIVFHRNAHL